MNVPLNWLREFVKLPEKQKDLTDALTMAGHMLDKVSNIDDDIVIDLELRGNRADCYSIIGIAREVAALFNTELKKPELLQLNKSGKLPGYDLKVNDRFVKRAGFIEINNVSITESPKWLIKRLADYGIESVNNIVDLTNYVMLEIGEPMHAFDRDKVGKDLQIRLAKDGEQMVTFAGSTLTLTKEDLVWAKGNTVLSVAGAIGEKTNSISTGTKNVLLEAANYDRANIRRSVHRHNIYTEAGIRHEKDLDPNLVEIAISRYLYYVKKNNWGTFKPVFYDYYPKKVLPWDLPFNIDRFNEHSGIKLEKNSITKILRSLGFDLVKGTGNELLIRVPTIRTDVTLEEDLYEEVLRIYGYDNIPSKTLSLEIPGNITPDFIKQEIDFRRAAESVGLNEIISLPFVRKEYADINVNPEDAGHKIASVINPPSPDTRDLRQTLLPNLLFNCRKIINERGENAALFEIGKVYGEFGGKYYETRKLGISYWTKTDEGFSKFKGILNAFFSKTLLPEPDFVSEIKMVPLTDSYNITVNNKVIGFGGRNDDIYFAELDLDGLLGKSKKYESKLWPKYPPQLEDITLTLPVKTKIGTVLHAIEHSSMLINYVELKDVYENSYTFRIEYLSPQKTLENQEIEKIRHTVITNLQKQFGATVK